MIELTDLNFSYGQGDFALHLPELTIAAGETVAVVGPSGSGKTTLLNLIAGIVRPLAGRIIVNGNCFENLDERQLRDFRVQHMGLVFQEFELLEYLDVLDNLLLPFRVSRALDLTPQVRLHAERLAEEVDIIDKIHRYPSQLSHGERQRVAVCRALMTAPGLLLADEPTGNLDPANKSRVLDILLDFARKHSSTLVTVTHDYDLIPRFDRVFDFRSFQSVPPVAPEVAVQ